MPTIEIVSINSTALQLNQENFSIAIIEEDKLISHRELFYDLLRQQNGISNKNILYKPDGSKRIADLALVALTLMIAERKSEEKEIMVKVMVKLINIKN